MANYGLSHVHRDQLGRVIRGGDHVVWSNRKVGSAMRIGTVESATPEKIRIYVHNRQRYTNVFPGNVIVITEQLLQNVRDNVGANA